MTLNVVYQVTHKMNEIKIRVSRTAMEMRNRTSEPTCVHKGAQSFYVKALVVYINLKHVRC